MVVESDKELEALKRIGRIVADCLGHMRRLAEEGMTTRELDAIGAAFLELHGARSAPMLMYNFPGTTCISVNNAVAHGIPSERRLAKGDLVNVDVSAELEGFFGDTGGSFVLGGGRPALEKLCAATLAARDAGIAAATAGARLSDIGKSVEKVARKGGYSIIKNLASHGVGRSLHEEPKHIANHFDPTEKRFLRKGLVITVEPFLSTGPTHSHQEDDGWTLTIPKSHRAAQFEHSIVVTDGAPIILTQPSGLA